LVAGVAGYRVYMSTHDSPETGLESLGTPADLRAPQPPIDEPPLQDAPAELTEPLGDWHANKRHGIAGLWDSIAYGAQFVLLSIYATGDQPEQSDPVEKLRRKYGRPPRKF